MQFRVNQMLQLVRGVAFLGVDARLDQQRLGVDPGLFQRQFETVVLGRQGVLERLVFVDDRLLLLGVQHGLEEQGLGVDPQPAEAGSEAPGSLPSARLGDEQ